MKSLNVTLCIEGIMLSVLCVFVVFYLEAVDLSFRVVSNFLSLNLLTYHEIESIP